MDIATTSVAIAAGSADPLVEGCKLRWPKSANDSRVNLPIPLAVAVAMTFLLLATYRGGGMISTHLAWDLSNLHMYYRFMPGFNHGEGVSPCCSTVYTDVQLCILLLRSISLLNPGKGEVMTVVHFI